MNELRHVSLPFVLAFGMLFAGCVSNVSRFEPFASQVRRDHVLLRDCELRIPDDYADREKGYLNLYEVLSPGSGSGQFFATVPSGTTVVVYEVIHEIGDGVTTYRAELLLPDFALPERSRVMYSWGGKHTVRRAPWEPMSVPAERHTDAW